MKEDTRIHKTIETIYNVLPIYKLFGVPDEKVQRYLVTYYTHPFDEEYATDNKEFFNNLVTLYYHDSVNFVKTHNKYCDDYYMFNKHTRDLISYRFEKPEYMTRIRGGYPFKHNGLISNQLPSFVNIPPDDNPYLVQTANFSNLFKYYAKIPILDETEYDFYIPYYPALNLFLSGHAYLFPGIDNIIEKYNSIQNGILLPECVLDESTVLYKVAYIII